MSFLCSGRFYFSKVWLNFILKSCKDAVKRNKVSGFAHPDVATLSFNLFYDLCCILMMAKKDLLL